MELNQKTRARSDQSVLEEDKQIEEAYSQASKFVNYLLQSDDSE